MAEKKSILEEALLDIKNIQGALNANTREILRSVAREEIDSVVKESLNKEVYEEEDLDSTEDKGTDLGGDAGAATKDVETGIEGGDKSEEGNLDSIEGTPEVNPEIGSEEGMNATALDGAEMDMTKSSDDDVIAIYKKLSGEDEIEIVGDEIHLNISEPGEYVVKANDTASGDETKTDEPSDLAPVDGGEEESPVEYNIEMGDEGGEQSAPEDLVPAEEDNEEDKEGDEVEGIEEKIEVGIGMSVGKHSMLDKDQNNIGQPKGAGANSDKKSLDEAIHKNKLLFAEAKKLKAENEEFRAALKEFRNKLVKTVVFNSNLTYATRLFMEHSTTKAEKDIIIKRFDDNVTSLVESKKLYKTIVAELESRKPINETIERKIIKEVSTGASKQLNESTAYVDPSTKRIIDLMKRVETR